MQHKHEATQQTLVAIDQSIQPKEQTMQNMQNFRLYRNRTKQSGFTMIELLIVIVILGTMGFIGQANWADKQSAGDPLYYKSIADAAAVRWRSINQECNIQNNLFGSSPVSSTVSATGNLQTLVEGSNVAAAYTACYQQAKVEPLGNMGISGTGGTYTVNGNSFTIAGTTVGAINRLQITFANVADSTVLKLVNKYGGQSGATTMTALVAAGDSTDTRIQYGVAGSGSRSLTIIQ